jgi:phosphoglycolate phosphatase
MKTFLFDIDGTLLNTSGAGMRAISATMKQLFGTGHLPHVEVHGRTDRAIVGDLMTAMGICVETHLKNFYQSYWHSLPDFLEDSHCQLLPGVAETLEILSARSDVALGLLTGNAARAAEIKLRHFDVDRYFRFGGYGDLLECRNAVAQQAIRSAVDHLGDRFEADQVWVIGDTINDIRCGRAIASKVIAVETGGASPEELAAALPDYQLPHLNPEFIHSILDD